MIVALALLIPVAGIVLYYQLSTKWLVEDRLQSLGSADDSQATDTAFGEERFRGVAGWLYRAGFRQRSAEVFFWVATLLCFSAGLLTWFQLNRTGVIDLATDFVTDIPGGVGNVMVPFLLALPWFFIVFLTLMPTLLVRSIRRRRVQELERDLPLMLDLLNTLSHAGVGFDSALEQILNAQSPDRVLSKEFRLFQVDNLAGRSRVDSLRRLMRRVNVPMFSTFISAIVQAEQVGAGIGDTLKTQAKEMRARRREKASAAIMSVPTLLVLPMVVGFLPGIFVVLIGPMLYQTLGAFGQTVRGVTGQ